MLRYRSGETGKLLPQGRMAGRERTRAGHEVRARDLADLCHPRVKRRVPKASVDAQHDRANRTGPVSDARENETLEFRGDAKRLGIPNRSKPFSKSERRNLRNAKGKDLDLYARLLAQYSDPTRR